MSKRGIKKVKILDHARIGDGPFLQLQQARVRLVLDDGSETGEGTYEYLDREVGRDAVVVVLWRHHAGAVEVLIRRGLRMPVLLRKSALVAQELDPAPGYTLELVAGLIEADEERLLEAQPDRAPEILQSRALAEVEEEAGLALPPSRVHALGSFIYPTTGVFAERLYFFTAEVFADDVQAVHAGDGSIFEEGADVSWWPLHTAIMACSRGQIADMKTEIGLRRLDEMLQQRRANLTA